MSDNNEIKVGRLVLSEDDLEYQVTYKGEIFTMRLPTPFEKANIEAEIVRKLGGFARSSYSPDHLYMIEAISYVDQLTIYEKCPSWFRSAWACYDDECIVALYNGYLSFRRKLQERIRNDGPEKGGKGDKS